MPDPGPEPPRPPFLVGYARVSTDDQDCQRQIDALVEYGVARDDIFTDKASGANMDRGFSSGREGQRAPPLRASKTHY